MELHEHTREIIEGVRSERTIISEDRLFSAVCRSEDEAVKVAIKRTEGRKLSGDKTEIKWDILSEEMLYEAKLWRSKEIMPAHLLLALVNFPNLANKLQRQHGITRATLIKRLIEHKQAEGTILDAFATNLTGTKLYDPVIGRDREVERIVKVLTRRYKNNPVLIGVPGIGKTATAIGFAQRLGGGDLPQRIQGQQVWHFNLSLFMAQSAGMGRLEANLIALIEDIVERDNVVLFIDELHRMPPAMANALKPELASGVVSLIGCTTADEYREIEKDKALTRRLQIIYLEEPSIEETMEITRSASKYYGAFHDLTYTQTAIDAAVHLSERYLTNRFQPDKSLDLLDETGAGVSLLGRTEVRKMDIALTVENMTGIPVDNLIINREDKLLNMQDLLNVQVIGQPAATQAVTDAVIRSHAGLRQGNRPTGVFIFLGPTGVGKTELARVLAEHMFDDREAMVRLDMSEYQEQHSVARLFGSPPGYVGYGEGGQLTEPIRRRPYQIVLFDEIEKAHAAVFASLLQLMDDGRMTDGLGNQVDFTNTIVIMTSNAAPDLWAKQPDRETVEHALRDVFPPEFVNRVDDLVVFNHLDTDSIDAIVDLRLGELQDIMGNTKLTVTPAARKWLAQEGYQPEFGARPVQRLIQSRIVNTMAKLMVGKKPKKIVVDFDKQLTVKGA